MERPDKNRFEINRQLLKKIRLGGAEFVDDANSFLLFHLLPNICFVARDLKFLESSGPRLLG